MFDKRCISIEVDWKDHRGFRFVAIKGDGGKSIEVGEIIGAVMKDHVEIERFDVVYKYRCHGIGQRLMQAVEKAVKEYSQDNEECNIKEIRVTPNPVTEAKDKDYKPITLDEAIIIYRKLGFSVKGEFKDRETRMIKEI